MNEREKETIEKDFIFLPFLFIFYLLLFFPFRRLRRYIVLSPVYFDTARRLLRRAAYSSLSICGNLFFISLLFFFMVSRGSLKDLNPLSNPPSKEKRERE
jgi:hypothetical protein